MIHVKSLISRHHLGIQEESIQENKCLQTFCEKF